MSRPLLSLAFCVSLGLVACSSDAPQAEHPAAVAAGERMVVREAMVADLKPVSATVTTRDMGEARARIGGTLTRLAVKEGDYVKKGQLVGVVTDQRLGLQTSAYAAQAAAAGAEAVRAEADLSRVAALYEKGIYAKARLDQATAAARAARAQVKAAEAQRAASAEVSAQGAVLAPTSGRVLHADVPAGSVVQPGQSIATVTAGDPLLRIEIPEARARALKVGELVPLAAEDLPGAAGVGVVAQVYPAVTSGRVMADIKVAGLHADLIGRRVRVQIKVGERRAMVIPARFVATRYGIDFVRVAGKSGAADVAVQTAPTADPALVEVLSGLQPGDVIVAPGARR
ncbi:MAG TPA: efflux RND transporter periplasmic adaptor subunit [Caulobacteraceae bacterium]